MAWTNAEDTKEVAELLSEDFVMNTPVSKKLIEKLSHKQRLYLIMLVKNIEYGKDAEQSLEKIKNILDNVRIMYFPQKKRNYIIYSNKC